MSVVDSDKGDVALIITGHINIYKKKKEKEKRKSLTLIYLSSFEVLLQEHLLFCHFHVGSNI